MDKLVSVIVPAYNAAAYLGVCLDSILCQTYKLLEVIVVNDGSTDNTKQLLSDYVKKDNRIIAINQTNKGVSAARNAGLEVAGGEYVVFMDSDDWIDAAAIGQAINAAEQYTADLVFWNYIREYEKRSGKVEIAGQKLKVYTGKNIAALQRRMVGPIGKELSEPQKMDSHITVWGKLYRRQSLDNLRFVDTSIIGTAEDALFNIQAMSQINIAVYLPEAWNHYRKTNVNSLTHCYKKELADRWRELYRLIKGHLEDEKASSEYYEALSNRICLGLIGLGLNLAEDTELSLFQKRKELDAILTMSHYRKALRHLPARHLPVHWRVFFLLAKTNCSGLLLCMLMIMNRLR